MYSVNFSSMIEFQLPVVYDQIFACGSQQTGGDGEKKGQDSEDGVR